MEQYPLLLTFIGLAVFTVAWMPTFSGKTGISYAILYLIAGFVLYSIFPEVLPDPLPQDDNTLTLHLTELVVIISLMGTGLKIDTKFSFRKWAAPLKLVGIAMLFCIVAAALLGYYWLGFGLASAVLLGAVLAPTDPVLAGDVQVGPPNEKSQSPTRFTLTAEAGLNDGVAFPFTWLAITLALLHTGEDTSLWHWFLYDLLYRSFAGVVLGLLFGRGIGYLVFKVARRFKKMETSDGMLAVAMTLLVYGATELAHGYGFIAVFVCAITFRHYEAENEYHDELHSFTDQIERLILSVLLILLGGAVAKGILEPITWQMVVFVVVFLFIIRPLFSALSLIKCKIGKKEKLIVSFFGIRGIGSLFYLSFAISEFNFEYEQELWAIVALTIVVSIILHGLSASPAMRRIERRSQV